MFSILIMLLIMCEIIIASLLIFFINRLTKNVHRLTCEIIKIKNEVIEIVTEYRVSLRVMNKNIARIKENQQLKQFMGIINLISGISFLLGFRKKFL